MGIIFVVNSARTVSSSSFLGRKPVRQARAPESRGEIRETMMMGMSVKEPLNRTTSSKINCWPEN